MLLRRVLTSQLHLKCSLKKDTIATTEDAGKDFEKEEADSIYAKISLTYQNSKPPQDTLHFYHVKYAF